MPLGLTAPPVPVVSFVCACAGAALAGSNADAPAASASAITLRRRWAFMKVLHLAEYARAAFDSARVDFGLSPQCTNSEAENWFPKKLMLREETHRQSIQAETIASGFDLRIA